MLDGAEEGDINTLAITRYIILILEMVITLFLGAVINKLNYGDMMMVCNISVE